MDRHQRESGLSGALLLACRCPVIKPVTCEEPLGARNQARNGATSPAQGISAVVLLRVDYSSLRMTFDGIDNAAQAGRSRPSGRQCAPPRAPGRSAAPPG